MLGGIQVGYIVNLVLLFFVYSCAGWCMEVILKYRQYNRFINRGFMTGPILPIYGSGAVLITVAVDALARYDNSWGTIFFTSFFLCGTVEFLTSWLMEKRFHARWWDYSQKPMNLNGRVWIGNLILFGLAGVLISRVSNPILLGWFNSVSLSIRQTVVCVMLAVFAADYLMSHFIMKLVKAGIEQSEADNTEEIGREIRVLLSDKTIFHKRFADAYPDVVYRTERITARMEAVKAETEKLRQEAERRLNAVNQRLDQGREQLAATLEPTSAIRSSILEKQAELIGLMYDEASATEEMKALKRDIDRNAERLKSRSFIRKGSVK